MTGFHDRGWQIEDCDFRANRAVSFSPAIPSALTVLWKRFAVSLLTEYFSSVPRVGHLFDRSERLTVRPHFGQ
jgi:hypothetical protein